MNVDGSALCCDDIKEHQQEQRENAFLSTVQDRETSSHEINQSEKLQQEATSDASAGVCPSLYSGVCVSGGSVEDDVVMEIPTNFPEWSTTGATIAAAAATGPMMRRVSFPNDKHLVTGYMEPADPWANGELTLQIF